MLGGIIWLAGYHASYQSVEFDGPAGLFLLTSIAGGWIPFSVLALILYGRKSLGKAILITVISGFIVGGVMLFSIGSYAIEKYANGPMEYNEESIPACTNDDNGQKICL